MKFVPELRVVNSIKKSLKIYCDNELVVQYSYNNKKSDTVNHININYYVVKEKIQGVAEEQHGDPASIPREQGAERVREAAQVRQQHGRPVRESSSLWLSSLYSLSFI
jgi:hypothetical protein